MFKVYVNELPISEDIEKYLNSLKELIIDHKPINKINKLGKSIYHYSRAQHVKLVGKEGDGAAFEYELLHGEKYISYEKLYVNNTRILSRNIDKVQFYNHFMESPINIEDMNLNTSENVDSISIFCSTNKDFKEKVDIFIRWLALL